MNKRIIAISIAFGILYLLVAITILLLTARGKVLPSIISGFIASPILLGQTIVFILAVLGIHVLLALLWLGLARPVILRLKGEEIQRSATLIGFLLLLFVVMLANNHFFPDSKVVFWTRGVWIPINSAVLVLTGTFVAAVLLTGGILHLRALIEAVMRRRLHWVVLPLLLLGLVGGALGLTSTPATESVTRDQPDIILLGVDGVRPDHMGFYNPMSITLTPVLDELLAESTVFYNAWTPLARTFPSWATILTGQYPGTHGGFFNLLDPARVQSSDTISHDLGALGYHRIYAIDESRFSNLDETFGFDVVVAPALGAADFLLGALADLPLLNLVANTRPARLLFPNIHMNRALAFSYRPETFDAQVARAIRRAPPDQPLLLAVHYELPHWPYGWANHHQFQPELPVELYDLSIEIYQKSVARVDEQVAAVLEELDQTGRLDQAVMVILSDHGETFRRLEEGWTWVGPNEPRLFRVNRHGHGTSVANESQNRVILGFRGFGDWALPVAPRLDREATTSLVDIRQTLEEWVNIEALVDGPRDGYSLMPAILNEGDPALSARAVTIETGFSIPSIEMGNPGAAAVVEAGADYYDVNRAGRMIIREEWLPFLISQKQRAAISSQWILAAFPMDEKGKERRYFMLDMENRLFWDAHNQDATPDDFPVALLVEKLERFFGLVPYGIRLDQAEQEAPTTRAPSS